MEQITKSIYVETKAKCISVPFGESYFIDRGANPGCVITEKGLVQIDATKNPMYALHWIESVKTISDIPYSYVINTDHHLDHVLCNYCFNAPVISHYLTWVEVKKFETFTPQKLVPFMYSKELYKMLKKRDEGLLETLMKSYQSLEKVFREPYETLRIVPAEVTFGDKATLHMGDKTLEMIHVGGHATDSILVFIPEERVLFAGDSIFNDLLPNMSEADTARWLRVLEMIEKMDVETIVPGHGHPCNKKALNKLSQYILELRNEVASLVKKGHIRDEVVSTVNMTSFFPIDNDLGWTKERVHDWSKDNTGRVFDELTSVNA